MKTAFLVLVMAVALPSVLESLTFTKKSVDFTCYVGFTEKEVEALTLKMLQERADVLRELTK